MAKNNDKKEKKQKKKGNGCLLGIILLIILVLLLIYLMKHFGFGLFGDGKGKEKGTSSSSSVSESVDKTTSANEEAEEKVVEIAVSGNEYFYDDGKTTVESFISELKGMSGKVSVKIVDNNAYYEYVDELMKQLDKENIPYIEPQR